MYKIGFSNVNEYSIAAPDKSEIIQSHKNHDSVFLISISNLNFKLETDIRNMESWFLCDCMISDLSGAAIEYAFAFEKPILYIVTPEKIVQKKQIDLVSLEEKIRPQIGEVISLSQLSLIPSKINQLLLSQNKFKEKIQKIREETVFNIGNSGVQGAKYLLELKKSLVS